jgi:hypothetical protein
VLRSSTRARRTVFTKSSATGAGSRREARSCAAS